MILNRDENKLLKRRVITYYIVLQEKLYKQYINTDDQKQNLTILHFPSTNRIK